MRIVLLCNEYPPRPHGGIGTFVHTIAHGLSGRGHKVIVVGLGEANAEHLDQKVRVVTLRGNNLRYVGNLISRIQLRKWLSDSVKNGQIDIIEAPDYMGLLPFSVNGCPVVVRLHTSDTSIRLSAGKKKTHGIFFYERHTLTANHNWIAVSHYILHLTQSTFGVSPKRSTIIYNPVPPAPRSLPQIPGLPENYVLYASAVSRRKGAFALAEAAREIMARRPDLHLVYAGGIFKEDGRPISEHICDLLGRKLAERVHFLGHVDRAEVLACMTQARVFVLPSHIESFGLVIVEAMSCGAPVVFTKNLPGPEIVEDGVTGLLVDPTSPKDIREKICRILEDSVLAKTLAENARKVVAERFSIEKCVEATERFYEECLRQLK